MEAEIKELYRSPNYAVHNFLCRCTACSVSAREYLDCFSIVYIRRGNFQFKVFRNDLDVYHGLFLINKPGYEYRVGHIHDLPDECTIFRIPADQLPIVMEQAQAFAAFFADADRQSLLLPATPGAEYLHHSIFRLLHEPRIPRLRIESLIIELLLRVLSWDGRYGMMPPLSDKQKRHDLPGIEAVKTHIHAHYTEDLGLSELARIGHLSPYHFNRWFNRMTSVTPYQYLLRVRLEQAQQQLRNTVLPVTDIAFSSGFNSLEHFSAAFKKLYGSAPTAARRGSKKSNFS